MARTLHGVSTHNNHVNYPNTNKQRRTELYEGLDEIGWKIMIDKNDINLAINGMGKHTDVIYIHTCP